jgi:hypothetical protein
MCKVINEVTERWAKQNKWVGEFDWWDEELWIAPLDWGRSADEWLCRFFLDGGAGDEWRDVPEEDSFWLTRLCQKGRGVLGFRWWYSEGLGATKSAWRKFIRDQIKYVEAIGRRGFVVEDSGLFFVELKVDANKLADAIQEENFETAFKPLQAVLDQLVAAKPQFDALLNVAKKELIS